MKTIATCTLGCKVNQYDTEAMLELFERAGWTAVPFSAALMTKSMMNPFLRLQFVVRNP